MVKFFCSVLCIFCFSSAVCGQQPDSARPVRSRIISFSGHKWMVRSGTTKKGPGPNFFSDSCVFVDGNGWLHLRIRYDLNAGQWRCAEITSVKSFEYGTYTFVVDGAIDRLDKNIVLGLFNYSGNGGLDEMDIEIARWGNAAWPNLNYTIWPASKEFKDSSAVKEFSLRSTLSTHYFRRSSDTVVCASFNGISTRQEDEIFSFVFAAPAVSISHLAMPVHLNFWLFQGNAPSNHQEAEVVVRSFTFKGL